MKRIAIAAFLAACSAKQQPPMPGALTLDTRPGLSDLAVDAGGTLWTVAERDRVAYQIDLDGTVHAYPIEGAPEGQDLEAMAWVDGQLRFGTEGEGDTAQVLTAELRGDKIAITGAQTYHDPVIGPNHGIESMCDTGVFAYEIPAEHDGKRWAQLDKDGTRYEVALTSDKGKIADLDCRGDDILAIERHFGISRLIRFRLGDASATVVRDLIDVVGKHNIEGLARLPDGRIALVNDNQYKGLDGPSQLIILPAAP